MERREADTPEDDTMTIYSAKAAAYLAQINATEAVRFGACGTNNNLRRGAWEIATADGKRNAASHEARMLNKLAGNGFGSRTITSSPTV
jgi:hypothetical protein